MNETAANPTKSLILLWNIQFIKRQKKNTEIALKLHKLLRQPTVRNKDLDKPAALAY